jgi:predicted nuclease of predicted toxin-antitoxin system
VAGGFKLDENLPLDAETLLSDAGHDVETVLNERLAGQSDGRVFEASKAEGRILVTLDLDFADIRLYPPSTHPGIWVLRPRQQSIESILALLRGALSILRSETAQGRLWIVEPTRVRIHE